jgi:penicillin-binding protein 1A
VYFGANAYGAEAAARTYFDKSATELTLPELALLAGIINLPGTHDPFSNPASARARRDVVLDRMREYGYITQEEYEEASAQDLALSRRRVEYENDNQYFLDAVRKELAEQ